MKKLILSLFIAISGISAISVGQTAQAQTEPPYGMSEIAAYAIFSENYRSKNYEFALDYGKWMINAQLEEIPGTPYALDKHFERMIRVYEGIAENQSDPTLKVANLDSALVLFDKFFETFSEEEADYIEWTFKLGRFYQQYSSLIEGGLDMAFANYEKNLAADPERFVQEGDEYYARILLKNYVSSGEKEKALAMIDAIEPYAGLGLQEEIVSAQDELFSDPLERIEFIKGQLEEEPDSEDLLSELAELYEDQQMREEAIAIAEKLYAINPSYENTHKLAEYASANAQYEMANKYLKESLELTDEVEKQRMITLEIAENYQNLGDLKTARDYAKRASNIDSSWGQPYLRVASIYASAISECTKGRPIERNDKTVYWLVLDYLDRAKRNDSSVSNLVDRQYQSYTPVLPTTEDKFFEGWEVGDSMMINGNINECYAWIGEATKVR